MNKLFLNGRLTKDIDLQTYGKGKDKKSYARFSIAVDNFSKDKDSDFFNLVAFGKTAEFLDEYVKKGAYLVTECHLTPSQYETDKGDTVTTVSIVVDRVDFAEKR